MFGLLEKLAELLNTFGVKFLESRRLTKDVEVAQELVGIVMAMQELCMRGERILRLVEEDSGSQELELLLEKQIQGIEELRSALDGARGLLATIDTELYFELAPFLDSKSGLLTRWRQQAQLSRFSTTTMFFLPAQRLEELVAVGKAHTSEEGLSLERDEYVMAVGDSIRDTRRSEVRDIRKRTEESTERLRREVGEARAELVRARQLCGQLLTATQQAIGPEGLAGLRRRLAQ
jgi:hypothetical protein